MRYEITEHALIKMGARSVTERQVKKTLRHGARQPSENNYAQYGKQFVFIRKMSGAMVHVVAAIVQGVFIVITVWRSDTDMIFIPGK